MSAKKIVLITGANRGLGLETARQLGRLGFIVVLGSRDLVRGEEAAATLRAEGIDARALKLDVVSAVDRKSAVEWITGVFGVLDVLVNNAGTLLDGSRDENRTSITTPEVLRGTFETNFFAVVELTQALLPLLRKSPAARIVNVSSVLASLTLAATPGSGTYNAKVFAYNVSKAALNGFTIHLAHELRQTKIKVNSAHPGWVKTEMGTADAPMELVDGAKTEVELATLPDDGPTGGFFHMGERIAW